MCSAELCNDRFPTSYTLALLSPPPQITDLSLTWVQDLHLPQAWPFGF